MVYNAEISFNLLPDDITDRLPTVLPTKNIAFNTSTVHLGK